MTITYADYFFRVLARYGALPLLLSLIAGFLLILIVPARLDQVGTQSSAVLKIVLVFAALAAIATMPAAFKSARALKDVFHALLSSPQPTGPLAPAAAVLSLGPSDKARSPSHELVRVIYPLAPHIRQQPTDARPISCTEFGSLLQQPPPGQRHRLVLFAPGLGERADAHETIVRDLASYGYIVVALNDLAIASPSETEPLDEPTRLQPFDFSSAEALAATVRRGAVRTEYEARQALRTLDHLAACVKSDGGLAGHIDVQHVGFVGYSFGGAVAVEAAQQDGRIAAVANLDGSLFGHAAEEPLDTPYLFISSDLDLGLLMDPESPRKHEFALYQRDLRLAATQAQRPDSSIVVIRGAGHATFTDHFWTLRNWPKWLLLTPPRAQRIVRAYLVGFLDAYLKGQRNALLAPGDRRYPEVRSLSSQD